MGEKEGGEKEGGEKEGGVDDLSDTYQLFRRKKKIKKGGYASCKCGRSIHSSNF